MNKQLYKILRILFGTGLMTIGAHFFFFPAGIAAGGVGGIGLVLNTMIPSLPIGLTVTVLNILLFILGFAIVGKEFGFYTFLGSVGYSVFLMLLEYYLPVENPIVTERLMNTILGSSFVGIGFYFVVVENASTGGTDVISKIIDKYTHIGISKAIFISDSMVILFATFVNGLEKGVYSIMAIIITTYILNRLLSGFNLKFSITIISSQLEEINRYINVDLNRGTTIYKAYGGYTKGERDILFTIVDRPQYVRIKKFVNDIDSNAFVFVNQTSEVIGEGFTRGL
ncbi:YitT family protein [Peptoniphilaceae bacterium SGI.131]